MTNSPLPYCTQCTDTASGVAGCFVYDPLAYAIHKNFVAVGPIFPDLVAFFTWANKNKIALIDHAGRPVATKGF